VNNIKISQISKKNTENAKVYSPLGDKEAEKQPADSNRSFENLAVPLSREELKLCIRSQNHHMSNTCAVLDQFSHQEFYDYYHRLHCHK
jgi:hypothetical protein